MLRNEDFDGVMYAIYEFRWRSLSNSKINQEQKLRICQSSLSQVAEILSPPAGTAKPMMGAQICDVARASPQCSILMHSSPQ